jgi:hypothetical protein
MLQKVKKMILALLKSSKHSVIQRIAVTLKNYFPAMDQIIRIAQRRLNGENVPVTEKVFSLFEPLTELIMRSRRNKPVEFGHKILISETPEKFITDYRKTKTRFLRIGLWIFCLIFVRVRHRYRCAINQFHLPQTTIQETIPHYCLSERQDDATVGG